METYLKDVPRAGAVAVAIFAASMAAGRLLAARLSHVMSMKMLMMGSAVFGLAVTGMVPLSTNLSGFAIVPLCFTGLILVLAVEWRFGYRDPARPAMPMPPPPGRATP